jgi:hypothetical protein
MSQANEMKFTIAVLACGASLLDHHDAFVEAFQRLWTGSSETLTSRTLSKSKSTLM